MQRILLPTLIWISISFGVKALGSVERQNANHVSLGFAQSLGLPRNHSPIYSPSIYWLFYDSDGWRSAIGSELRYSASDLLSKPILTFSQSFLREFRLWSSVYWGPGFEMSFLYPSQGGKNLFSKDSNRNSEMGLGATLQILEHFSSRDTLELKLSRWRGLGTRNYRGFTYMVSYSYSTSNSRN